MRRDDVREEFPKNNVQRIREARGITRDSLAEMLDTTGTTVYRLETRRRELTHSWIVKIAQTLECNVAELLPEAGIIKPTIISQDIYDEAMAEVERSVDYNSLPKNPNLFAKAVMCIYNEKIVTGKIPTASKEYLQKNGLI